MHIPNPIILASLLLTPIIAGYVGYSFIKRYKGFSALWLGIAILIVGLWVFLQGLSQIVSPDIKLVLLYAVRTLGAICALCVFFFSVEYSTGNVISKKFFGACAFPIVIIHSLMVFYPESFMIISFTESGIVYSFEILGHIHMIMLSVLYLFSLAFLFRETLVTTDKLHNQARILFIGLLSGLILSIVPLFTIDYDLFIHPMALGLIVSVGTISYGLNKYDLYTTTPVKIFTLLENMNSGIFIINNRNQIIRSNNSATSFFDIDSVDILGQDICSVIQNNEFQSFMDSQDSVRQFEITKNNQVQYLKLQKQNISYGRNATGKIITIQDITLIESQKQQLDLLRQIFSRILRHNIRNNLTVINGFAEKLSTEIQSEQKQEYLNKITESTTSLLDSSNKAQLLSTATTEQIYPQVVSELISQGIKDVPQLSEETITTKLESSDTLIQVAPNSYNIISNALENIVKHTHEDTQISVIGDLRINQNVYVITIEDNGCGIPDEEIQVLNSNEEKSLSHGSGVGLWVMKLLTKHIGGQIDVTSSENGTTIEIHFKLAKGKRLNNNIHNK